LRTLALYQDVIIPNTERIQTSNTKLCYVWWVCTFINT